MDWPTDMGDRASRLRIDCLGLEMSKLKEIGRLPGQLALLATAIASVIAAFRSRPR